jgi:hypothetical protein
MKLLLENERLRELKTGPKSYDLALALEIKN